MIFNANPENYERELELMGGMSKKLLWQNASPTSEFKPQTLDDELADVPGNYDCIEIEYRGVSSGQYGETKRIKNGDRTYLEWTRYPQTSGNYMIKYSRIAIVSESDIFIDNGSTKAYNSNATTIDNSIIIPIAIYGIKGVQ